jgi:uncharacterized membrane protein
VFDTERTWSAGAGIMIALTFLAPFIYDALHKAVGKDPKVFGAIAFVLSAAAIAAMHFVGGFGYRGYNIHMGALFGSIMAFNVWYRIWPAQQQIIKGVKGDGPAAPPELVAFAGTRSRHNVYMSVPLVWTMINTHTTTIPTTLAMPAKFSWVLFLLVTALGWHLVWQMYKKAPTVKGF